MRDHAKMNKVSSSSRIQVVRKALENYKANHERSIQRLAYWNNLVDENPQLLQDEGVKHILKRASDDETQLSSLVSLQEQVLNRLLKKKGKKENGFQLR